MTVRELIKQLETYDGETEVLVIYPESGDNFPDLDISEITGFDFDKDDKLLLIEAKQRIKEAGGEV